MEEIMKKIKGILLLMMCLAVLAGCGKGKNKEDSNQKPADQQTATTQPTAQPTTAQTATNQTATKTDAQKIDINIAALKGPTAMGMVKIMKDAEDGTTANHYKFSIHGTAEDISTGLLRGEIDIAAVPCNLASALYNKTGGKIKMAGINTLGVLYVVETGNRIHKVEDLDGMKIYSTGFGTTPQYTLNYLLSAYGIDPEKDVTIEYKSEPTEVAALLSKSKNAVAMLPQPYVTTVMMNNSKVRIALNVADEWNKVSSDGSSVVTGVVVVRSAFLEKNKKAVDAFMKEYKDSAAYVNKNVDEAAALVEKYDIFKAAVAKKAIPYCNITMIRGNDMKKKVSGYLNVLYKQNPKSIGGKMPADDFYYMP
jgi:NitT/TauT family transport system substrate-binding protein